MVLTAKFGCARLYSRIIAPDTDSRRLNLQACYAEYQWIIAYAQKFEVQIFQEELALCREMVSVATAVVALFWGGLWFDIPRFTGQQASLIPAQIAALSSHGSVHAASCG